MLQPQSLFLVALLSLLALSDEIIEVVGIFMMLSLLLHPPSVYLIVVQVPLNLGELVLLLPLLKPHSLLVTLVQLPLLPMVPKLAHSYIKARFYSPLVTFSGI